MRGLAPAVLALVAGCSPGAITGVEVDAGPFDPDGGGPPCDPATSPNAAPATPAIVDPADGRIDVIPASFVIRTSAFADADGDAHAATAYELWRVQGGLPVERIWRAAVTSADKLTQVTLADGAFEGTGLTTGLLEWEDYVVRARHRDASDTCTAWSEWSADRTFKTDDGSSYLFDPWQIRDLYLDIPPASWDGINAQAIPPGCVPWERDYYPGTLTFEGQVLDGVGIKVKGGCGSARDLNQKAGLKVSLEWDDPAVPGCPAERRLFGMTHLTLNNQVQDGTGEHERLGYALYQAMGVPVPTSRSAHVRVYVNGEYYGVYLNVETYDRRFLSRWFSSNGGMLYEGTYWCDLVPGNVPPVDDDSYCLTREFKPDACDTPEAGDDPLTYDLLRNMVNQVDGMPGGGFYGSITSLFDYDTFLSMWAVESVIAHWDAYEFSIMNNYRVYHDPGDGRWTVIPHGIDQTFNGDQDPWGVSGVLAWRCLQEPACEAAFAQRLNEAVITFETMGLPALADQIHNQIRDAVYADPRKEYGNGSWESWHSEMLGWIANRPAQVRGYLASHGF